MGLIVCGWCGHATPADRCSECGREPSVPWVQRAQEPPAIRTDASGRPALDRSAIRRRIREATAVLEAEGLGVTNAALAERLDVSEKTVRRWRQL